MTKLFAQGDMHTLTNELAFVKIKFNPRKINSTDLIFNMLLFAF